MSLDGFWVEAVSSGDETYVATATRGIPGRPVVFSNPSDVTMWAQAVGLLHAASRSYTPSPVATRLGTIAGELPTLGDLWNQIEPVIKNDPLLRERYAQGSMYLERAPEPTQITHGDVRPENVLVSDGRVVLLDFDEPTIAWAPYDLARMMLDDDARPAANPGAHLSAIRAGYRRGRPWATILDDDVEQLLNVRVLLMYAWSLQDPAGSTETWLHQLRSLLCSPWSLRNRLRPAAGLS